VRIVIAEDSTLFREGLASLLTDAGHDIVARVGDALALMDAVGDHRPELAIIDVRMPPENTDDGARAALLRAQHRTWRSSSCRSTSRPTTRSTW
jgi:DNA-binding NarL/FixJ family response regulator